MMMRMDEREEEKEKTSECSSGCQSGWTMYLDQSNVNNLNNPPLYKAVSKEEEGEEEEEEEDLSMVSDASSGPPHFHEDEHYCYCTNGCFCSISSHLPSAAFTENGGGKKRRMEADCSLLDDTASSPFFSFSKTNCNVITTTTNKKNKKKLTKEELSCGFSATHFKEKPAMERHPDHRQSSAPAKTHSVCRGQGERKLW